VTVVQLDSGIGMSSPADDLLHLSPIVPPPQLDVIVHPVGGQSLVLETFGVVAVAFTFYHAGALGVEVSAWPMHHVLADDLVEFWLLVLVWDFCTDQGVEVGRGDGLVVGMEDDEEMGVR